MNSHKNAKLTWQGRRLLVQRIGEMGPSTAASAAGVSLRTTRKWLARFESAGIDGLLDRSSRPQRTRSSIDVELAERIEGLRRARMPVRRIATVVGRSVATVSRFVASLGLSRLSALEPAKPALRYEHEAPGELLRIDTKKLGCVVRPSHRVTGNRRDSVDGAGWEFAHVAIDDHYRAGFVRMHPDERKTSAVEFLKASVAHYAALGVTTKRLNTDNGSANRSKLFAKTCQALGIKHSFIKPHCPQTNGKAERFIQTCLREWAYGRVWANSAERTAWPPASRLLGNNVLKLNTVRGKTRAVRLDDPLLGRQGRPDAGRALSCHSKEPRRRQLL